jgi:energy-coupling factor transporter ATP-binding protein EcfA2
MQNYLCWSPAQVHDIINAEAEAVSDFVFKAVHSDQILMCGPPTGARFELKREAFSARTQQQFLDFFLDQNQRHMQVAVFGRSGSGKSHLIHWMKTAIREDASRIVLTIPKSGTSLRSIVSMIIERLPLNAQTPFHEALARAGDSVRDRDGQKHELLNQIAQAIREETVTPSNPDAEQLQAIISTLPDLFQDAYLRKQYFMRDENVISKLVDHVFSRKTGYVPQDDLQRFRAEDFPAGGRDYKNASEPARQAIQVLTSLPDLVLPMATAVVNRALDGAAIARAFGFTGDRIIELMDTLRAHLKSEGRELILLIEDLAQLQGIDRALLQALLNQGNDKLCNIRWALAATTGVFESVSSTVYTRLTLLIDMDHSSGGEAGTITKSTLAGFAGRYLNATRVGPAALANWFASTAGNVDELPNACHSCVYLDECHRGFGASPDGVGLYPFTESALWNMTVRADENLDHGFNPRVLQNNVLKPVLDSYADDLIQGTFPPSTLSNMLGGDLTLSQLERERLRRSVPQQEYERSLTYQDLWNGTSQLVQVPKIIQTAFNLSPLVFDAIDITEPAPLPGSGDSLNRQTDTTSNLLQDLDSWEGGKTISQRLAGALREPLFEAISSAIDWDACYMQRSFFASAQSTKPFRARSISFLRQETQLQLQVVNLTISPEDTGPGRAASALRGLLLAKRHGNWAFADAMRHLVALQDCVEYWATSVLEQFQRLLHSGKNWDTGLAALELLCVGACLTNLLKAEFTSAELLNAALGTWPEESGAHTPELKAVFKKLRSDRERLVSVFRAGYSGTKGGVVGSFIDPRSVFTISSLRRNKWALRQTAPAEAPRGDWTVIAKLYNDTVRDLTNASAAEHAFRLSWLAEMRAAFGDDLKKADIISASETFLQKVSDMAVGGKTITLFRDLFETFKTVQLDDAFRAAAALEGVESPETALPAYGRARANAFEASRSFYAALSQLAQTVRSELNSRSSTLGDDAVTVSSDLLTIGNTLKDLDMLFSGRAT